MPNEDLIGAELFGVAHDLVRRVTGDERRQYRVGDDRGHQVRVLRLIDDAVQ